MDESERIALTVEPAFSGMRLDAYLREQDAFLALAGLFH